MSIDNLHPHSNPKDRTPSFLFYFEGLESVYAMKRKISQRDGIQRISLVSWFVMKWCPNIATITKRTISKKQTNGQIKNHQRKSLAVLGASI